MTSVVCEWHARWHDALIAKRLRQSTWRRAESHNKQLQHFLDRERYQQNASWQSEYDRLRSTYTPGLQPYVDDRMQALGEMIAGRKLDKLQWQPMP